MLKVRRTRTTSRRRRRRARPGGRRRSGRSDDRRSTAARARAAATCSRSLRGRASPRDRARPHDEEPDHHASAGPLPGPVHAEIDRRRLDLRDREVAAEPVDEAGWARSRHGAVGGKVEADLRPPVGPARSAHPEPVRRRAHEFEAPARRLRRGRPRWVDVPVGRGVHLAPRRRPGAIRGRSTPGGKRVGVRRDVGARARTRSEDDDPDDDPDRSRYRARHRPSLPGAATAPGV